MPDADRIFSRFAALQFLFEGLATCAVLAANLHEASTATATATAAASGTSAVVGAASFDRGAGGGGGAASASEEEEVGGAGMLASLQETAFGLAMTAMAVPMLQLLEQRLLTPCIGILQARGVSSPLALLATLYMLAASLPRKIMNLIMATEAHDNAYGAAKNAAASATADAGDDAVENEYGGDGGDEGSGNKEWKQEEAPQVELAAEQVTDAAVRVTRLVGRALAAKEAGGKALGKPTPPSREASSEHANETDTNLVGLNAVARLRRKARMRTEQDGDDNDDD